jgi:hypothetical protein
VTSEQISEFLRPIFAVAAPLWFIGMGAYIFFNPSKVASDWFFRDRGHVLSTRVMGAIAMCAGVALAIFLWRARPQ